MRTEFLEELKHLVAVTDRIKRHKEEYLKARPRLLPERGRIATESWKRTEGDPLSLRYAKAYQKVLEEIPIEIRDWELLVGSLTHHMRGMWTVPEWWPEVYSDAFKEEVLTSLGPAYPCDLDEAAKESILEDCRYWEEKSVAGKIKKEIYQTWGNLVSDLVDGQVIDAFWNTPPGLKGMDWPKVLAIGLNGVIAEIKEEIDKLKTFTAEEVRKLHFLQASLTSCQAVVTFAKRYAQLAREIAAQEQDKERKSELEDIAERLEHSPAEPVRNFPEALQSYWICLIASELEAMGLAPSIGRFDQYLYPYYSKDIREGKITNTEVAELLASFLLKLNELELFRRKDLQEGVQGTYLANLVIGGQTADGKDAVNELSFLVLEAARQVKVPQPHISLRYHDNIDEDFLIKGVECNRDHGAGIPAWFNDRAAILSLSKQGVPIETAREKWIPIGCVERFVFTEGVIPRIQFFNLPKMLEVTLHNGVDPRTGKKWGLSTGDPREFTSFDEFYMAFKEQLAYIMDINFKVVNHAVALRGEYYRLPLWSTFVKDCMEKGLDWTQGGQRWHGGLELAINPMGGQTTACSLAAIKKLVYEDKSIRMDELLDALACNFEGKEDVQRLLLSAPKWGNDDDYVDEILEDLFNFTQAEAEKYPTPFCSQCLPGSSRVWSTSRQGLTHHFRFGKVVGATPDGRKAYTPLSEGSVSPVQGTDVNGPTAVIKSASKVDHISGLATLLNMKISPTVVQNREGIKKLLALIKTHFDTPAHHIQFNMISSKTLLDAKEHPEQYRELLVRVAGYSAYFVELAPAVQDEIIARTSHEAV